MEEFHCLLDTPALRVSYDAANNWLYSQWRGQHDEAAIIRGANSVLACLQAQPCPKMLSDHSQLLGSWQGISARRGQQYFDSLAAYGVRYFAWVYAPCYPDRVAMEKARYFATHPVAAIFSDVASAYDWLRQCPNSPPLFHSGAPAGPE